jgi:hypothetical protein
MDNDMSTRAEILEQLKAIGVNFAAVEFSGEGDSGCIDSTALYIRSPGKLTDISNDHPDVADALNKLCDAEIEDTGIDWYNNGGGFGRYEIDLDHNTFEFCVYTRWVEESLEHDEQGSLEDWAANKTGNNDE